MSFVKFKNDIITIMAELVGAGQPFAAIYDFPEPSPGVYPCLSIFMNPSIEERLDSANNFLRMQFVIRIRVKTKNTSDAESLRLTCIDAVLDKLRENVDTLNGNVERLDTISARPFESSDSEFPIFGCDVIIEGGKIKPLF